MKINWSFSRKVAFLIVSGLCFAALLFSVFLENVKGLQPCPLCQSQRVLMLLVICIACLALLGKSCLWSRSCGGVMAFFAAVGAGLSLRQLWLQSLPLDQKPACIPDLQYLIDILPFLDILKVMVLGTGGCSEVKWEFLSISIPGWALVVFVIVLLVGVRELFRGVNKR